MGIKCPKCQFNNPDDTVYCGKCAAPLKSLEEISVTKTIITPTGRLPKGSTIAGKYQIHEELGRGGMGIVYKAEDTKLKRIVALKFLPPELTHISEVKERFMREAQAAAALDHPNICTVHEFDEAEEKTYISMAYIEGQSLKKKIESGQLELEEAIRLATQVAEGLQEAHKKGVVHRDIKSANIMVTEKDQAKIMDFGLARMAGGTLLTKEGMAMGTIAYMSPEQARGEDVDHRTDIWSFGVVLYEMLSGQLPFKGEKDSSIIYSIEHRKPIPLKEIKPEIPEELVQVVGKALTKNPQERYQQIEDLLNDLYSISKGFVPPKIKAAIRRARLLKIKRAYLYGSIAALSVLIIAAGLYFFSLRGKAIASIAVLPFENTSGDPDVEYLSDGVTETLINRLSKLQKIKKVIARTSVDAYKGQSIDPKKVGQELNVQVVLTGKMLQRGNELSISVELVSTRDNSHLWGDKYNRRVDDIFEIEEDIATEISQVLRLELTGEEKKQLAKRYTQDKEAYLLFLKGRYFMNKLTEEGFQKGIEFYNQAIDKDPNYALAYVGLAQFYIKSGMFGVFPPNEVYPRARATVDKALEIDETLAEALAWDGALSQWYEWDWSAAEKKFKRAIEMNLNNSEELGFYSWYLSCMRRYEEAIAIDNRCLEFNPLSPYENMGRGYTYFLAGRYDEAIVWMKKALELDSNYFYAYKQIARCYTAKGLYEEAIAEFDKAEEIYPQLDPEGIADKACIYATSGRSNEAIIALNKLTKLSKQRYVDPLFFGYIHACLDETDKAFEWLDKAFEVRSPGLVLLRTEAHNDNIFKNINSDPRYKALLKKMNLD